MRVVIVALVYSLALLIFHVPSETKVSRLPSAWSTTALTIRPDGPAWSSTAAPLACAVCSAGVTVMPVPVAPGVPISVTVVVSPATEIWSPRSNTLMLATFRLVAFAGCAAASVVLEIGPLARPWQVQVQ